MFATCFSTARRGDDERAGDPGVGSALGHQREHLTLPGGQRRHAVGVAGPARSSWPTTSGSSAVPPAATRVSASMNSATSATRSLSRYPTPAAAVGEQPGRVAGLDVLREHQHAGAGMVAADLDRGAQSLVGVRRWHPDVDHHDVGPCSATAASSASRVGHRGAHLEAAVLEQPDQPFPHHRGVLGDHHPHAVASVHTCSGQLDGDRGRAAGRAATRHPAVHDGDAPGQAGQAAAPAGSAPPMPSSPTLSSSSSPCPAAPMRDLVARLCLAALASSSAAQK